MALEQEYPDRRFVTFDITELNQIDFSQVFETSADTVRKSVDETKTFVKYDINIIEEDIVKTFLNPESMEEETFTTPAGIYGRPSIWNESYPELTHEEIINLLSTEAWSEPLTEA